MGPHNIVEDQEYKMNHLIYDPRKLGPPHPLEAHSFLKYQNLAQSTRNLATSGE